MPAEQPPCQPPTAIRRSASSRPLPCSHSTPTHPPLPPWPPPKAATQLTSHILCPLPLVRPQFPAFSRQVQDGAWATRYVDAMRDIAERTAPDLDPVAFGVVRTFFGGCMCLQFAVCMGAWSWVGHAGLDAVAFGVVGGASLCACRCSCRWCVPYHGFGCCQRNGDDKLPSSPCFAPPQPFLFFDGFKVIIYETVRNVIAAAGKCMYSSASEAPGDSTFFPRLAPWSSSCWDHCTSSLYIPSHC